MMEWENFQKVIKFLDNYDIAYRVGDYYDEEDRIIGHWLKIEEQYIDSEEV